MYTESGTRALQECLGMSVAISYVIGLYNEIEKMGPGEELLRIGGKNKIMEIRGRIEKKLENKGIDFAALKNEYNVDWNERTFLDAIEMAEKDKEKAMNQIGEVSKTAREKLGPNSGIRFEIISFWSYNV